MPRSVVSCTCFAFALTVTITITVTVTITFTFSGDAVLDARPFSLAANRVSALRR
jgi:hypothetical protein